MTSRWSGLTPTPATTTTTASITARVTNPASAFNALLLLMVLLIVTGASGSQQKFSVRPESVEVVEGGDVLLSCVVESQQGKAQWTKDGFALGFERDVPGYPRFQYAGEPSLGEHHLVITGATLTEDGEYQCQVGPTSTSPPIWAAANVTVILPPTGVGIVGWGDGAKVEVLTGTALNLECEVTGGRPASRVTWLRAGTPLPPELQEDSTRVSLEPRRWDTRSRLTVNTSPEDDDVAFTCRALHPGLPLPPPQTPGARDSPQNQYADDQAPMEASVTLSVLHPPGAPMLSGYSPGEVAVAGERRTITCTSQGGNPRPWVLWYRDGNLLDDTTTTTSFPSSSGASSQSLSKAVVNAHELALTPQEDGALLECRVSNDLLKEPLTANVTLTVYYAPATVTIRGPAQVGTGDALNLTCETSDSNPPASITWIIQGEVIENSKSVVAKDGEGGWVTSSRVSHQVEGGSAGVTGSVKVECRALNPAVEQVVRRTTTVTVTRPAGPPVFRSDLRASVVAGTMLDLTCVSVGGHPPPTIRVFKGEEELATEIVVEAGVTEARVELEVTAAYNRKEVSCDVTSTATNASPQSTSATLSVLFPPWEVTGEVKPGTVEEGDVVTLWCESSASLPASNITWTSTSASLHGAIVTTSTGAFGGTVTSSELHLSTTAEDNGRTFQCEASNGLGVAVHDDLTLSVLHAPRWIVMPPEQLDVYEGAELVVTAAAIANPGPLRYWWRRGEETLEATQGELRLGKVGRQLSGNYSVSAYNPRGAINASFVLNVQYGPEHLQAVERVTVGEGGAATVECSAGGNPQPTLTWTTTSGMNSTISHHSRLHSTAHTLSSGVGVARLVVEGATAEHTGLYQCHASNVVASAPPVATRVIVTQPPRVVVEAAGASGSWAAMGGRGRLVCRVRAAPAPSFSWTTEHGLTLQSGPKYDLHDPQLVDGLVLWASVLEVLEVEKEDYGKYSCSAHNALGSDSATLALNPPARPRPPTNFTITNITASTVSLAWIPNFTGGLPRGYTIRYRATGTLEHQTVELSGGNTAGTTLTGLTARNYLFTIKATNDQGASAFLAPPLLATLPAGPGDGGGAGAGAGRWRVPRLILVVMSLTGASLLVLNIAIIACFVRRRARTRLNPGSPSSTKMEVALDGYSGANSITSPHHSSSTSSTTATTTLATTTASPPPPPPPLPQQQPTTTASTTLLLHHHHNRSPFQPQHNNSPQQQQLQQQQQQQQQQQVVFPLPAGGCQVGSGEACEGESEVGPHASPLQNGGPLRRGSITSFKGGGGMNTAANGVRENGGVPCHDRRGSGGGTGGGCSGGGGGAGGESPYHHHHHHHHHLHPHHHHHLHNPEVCSLSSTYDTSPGLPTSASTGLLPQQEQRRGSDSAMPDDQISLASFHSNHSRTYSQGYIRPLPPPGCPHYPLHPCQSRPCPQSEPQSLPGSTLQQGQSYASLNPSSLYSLSADYYEARCGQQPSLTAGSAPLGYATLGPRSRRTHQQPSQFSTLQRPRGGRLQARECQANCCDYDDDFHSANTQQRRSSFHGPVRRCDTPDTADTQQHSTQQGADDGGYGSTLQQKQKQQLQQQQQQQQQQEEDIGSAGRGRGLLGGPRGGRILGRGGGTAGVYSSNRSPQQDIYSRGRGILNNKLGSRDPIVAVPAFLIPNSTNNNNNNNASSPPLPPPPPPTTTPPNIASTFAASTSRPRFPHDYVRQGSTKKTKILDKKK